MTNSTESTCPKCGAPLSEDAPQGLCPKCVLAEAATLAETSGSPAGRTPPPPIEEVAPHFPDLEILELIGAGGMGAVYKARQPKLDRLVALKILSQDLSADPAFEERFNREARVLARLNHPHIVTVFDFGTAGPFCFLLMEFVDGVNLRQAMSAGGFTPADTLALVQDVCAALKFAHEEGILHRDIKPENVLIDSRGRVKIADFGIAKLVGEDDRSLVTLTMQGAVLGSPHYMAPEQIETPSDVDQRADIYSLGVVFYELLTGELPLGRFAPPSEKSPLDPRIDEIVMRTLEKEREARFQSAEDVGTRVGEVTRSGMAPAPPAPAPSGSPASSPETARFATASSIFTGLSLVMGIPALIVIGWLFLSLDVQPSSSQPGIEAPTAPTFMALIVLIVGILTWSVPALLGLILGTIALGDIRRSGGRKAGLGRALFGALTWPIILIVVVAGLMLPMLLAPFGGSGPALSIPLLLGIGLLASGIAAAILVGAVGRWAKNTPRRTSTAWLTAVLIIGLLLVPSLIPMLLLAAGSPAAASDGPPDGPGSKSGIESTVGPSEDAPDPQDHSTEIPRPVEQN